MIISVPGMKNAGEHTYALAEFVDMYPTLCELCELPIPEHVEGLSFAPLLEDPGRSWRKAAFSQYPRGKVMGYTMRTDRYRYTEWNDRESGETKARELYDHQRDSQENVNVIGRPEYAEDTGKLEAMMKQGWRMEF